MVVLLVGVLQSCTSADILEIKVAGSPLKLSQSQPTGQITITNLSPSFYVYNIEPDLIAAKLTDKISVTDNGCSQVIPLDSCTITFKALVPNLDVTKFEIQGDNTDAVTISILVKTQSVPTPAPSAPTLGSIAPTQGTSGGGTTVTLTGTSLTGATSVTFDGIAATNVNAVNDTTVTADTPAHADGAVDVVITTANGSDTLVAAYTYGTAPNLTSIAPTQGTSAGGTSITLTGTHLTGTTSVKFGGVAATNVNVVNDTTVTADTPAHADGAVNVVVTTPYGSDSLVAGYTYFTPPALTSVTSNSGTASGNVGVTLTGTHLTGTSSITFDGVAATSVNVVNATTVTAVTPAHAAGAVDVSITTPTGTSTLVNGYTYVATAVGQSSAGGVIACLGGGLQDLIAASADNSAGIVWGGLGTTTNAQSDSDGAPNTTTIVGALGAGSYAASVCDEFEVDSQGNTPCISGNACYSDWFLPATDQLSCLYNNNATIGGFSTSSLYWGSTEFSGAAATDSLLIDFSSGSAVNASKDGLNPIRCVRSFTP